MQVYSQRNGSAARARAGLVVILLAALAAVTSCGARPPLVDRTAPGPVSERVVHDLQKNDVDTLYEELSPSQQQIFSQDQFRAAEQSVAATLGPISVVEVIETPVVLTGPEWNGEWADGRVRVTRGTTIETYVVRYHLENGQWWLFGTLKAP